MNNPFTIGAVGMITQAGVRAAFWRECFGVTGKPRMFWAKSQNQLPADVRTMWVNYVDGLQKSGRITERLAGRVTL